MSDYYQIERSVVDAINEARMDPKVLIPDLELLLKMGGEKRLKLENCFNVVTNS